MQSFDPRPPVAGPRVSLRRGRYVSGSVASDRIAALAGLLTALFVGLASYVAVIVAMPPVLADLDVKSSDVAATVAQSVAADLSRAVGLGIPLGAMRGVDDYLSEILGFAPEVDGIAILDRQERLLFSSRSGDALLDRPHARAPIMAPAGGTGEGEGGTEDGEGAAIGSVIAQASSATHAGVMRAIAASAATVALLAGILVGLAVRIVRLERVDLPTVRTAAMLHAAARGHFVIRGLTPAGVLPPVADALARAVTPIQLTYRRIQALVEEIKAVDGSAAVRQRVGDALGALEGLRLETRRGRLRHIGLVWWPAAALTVIAATRPLIANFAYDRIGNDPFAEVAVAFAVTAETIGAILGVILATLLAGRWSKPATFAAMLMAAAAYAAVYVIRDYRVFTATVTFAAFCGWFAVWSVLATEGAGRRLPWRGAIVLLGAAAAGPMIGGLLAEAEGRRAAFATLGVLAALLAVASTAGAPRLPQRRRPVPPALRLSPADVLALLAASLALFAWADVSLAGTVLRERYAEMALNFGLAGAASFVPVLLRWRLPAPAGGLVAAAAVLAGAGLVPAAAAVGVDVLQPAVSVLAGLGFGIVAFALGARAFVPSSAIAIGVGGVAAGALHAADMVQPGAGLALAAIAATALAGLAVLAAITHALGWAR